MSVVSLLLSLFLNVQEIIPPPDPTPHKCVELSKLSGNSKELNEDQRQFVAGIYAVNPNTPTGLPVGNKSMLITIDNSFWIIIFVDGDKACDPMPIAKEIVDMINDVGDKKINHIGEGS